MFKTTLTIEWGDCDEAGIVFYPNYFYWFDSSFQKLLRARGLSQRELRRRFGACTPIVRADAEFKAPARYDDEISIAVGVAAEGARRFRASYEARHGERLVATGYEVRAFATFNPDGSLRGADVPAEFLAALAA